MNNQIPFYTEYLEGYLDMLRNETQIIRPYVIFITNNMTLIYILLALIIVIFCAFILITAKLFGASRLRLKGPLHLPFIGSYYEFSKNKDRFYNWLLDCANKYGTNGAFYFSIPVKSPYVIILKPEYLKEVLKDNMNGYHREPIYLVCNELLGQGIFNVDGDIWQRQRRIGSHGFNTNQLNNNALKCFKECSDKLIKKINYYADNDIAFDIKDLFFRTTMDSICKIAFNYEIDSVTCNEMPPFAVAMDKCTRHMFRRIIDPLWRIKKIISLSDEIEYRNNIKKLDELCYEIIDKRIEDLQYDSDEEINDILSLFIKAIFKDYEDNHGTLEEIFQDDTKKYLRDIVFSFIIAGRDTTASTLSWMFFELLTKDYIVQTIKEEIDSIDELNNIYDYNNNLQAIQSAFYETLRLHPPVPMDVKYSKNDVVLGSNSSNAIIIPKDTAIIYSPFIMGRLREIWGDDVNEFKLERNHIQKSQYEFPCFNAGPRICLGKNFAILEAKVIVSSLFKKFNFVSADMSIYDKPPQYSLGVTTSPNNAIMVKAVKN
jgi:cytochrome P450